MKEFCTLDDFDVGGKTVILRVDINCPLNQGTLEIEDDNRIKQIMPTLRELNQKKAKVVIIAHQGRPGDWDFCSLESHAKILSKHLGKEVKYVDDLYGEKAIAAIRAMRPGDVLVLKNVRELACEQEKRSMEDHAQEEMVQVLSKVADIYVSDAFGAAHRAQCSLIGFQAVMPSAAGRLMEKELTALSTVFDDPARPCIFVLGGSKFSDSIKVIDRVLTKKIADKVILVGLSASAFLKAKGVDLGQDSEEILSKEFTPENLEAAKKLLAEKGENIILPVDVAVDQEGRRVDLDLTQLPNDYPIFDIGPRSVEKFRKVLATAGTIFMSGPAGVFEREEFALGTRELMKAAVESGAYTVIGGGHTVSASEKFGFYNKFSYVSTGGGALETYLLGKKMPVVEALRVSYLREEKCK
ncbi:MAG: Phosphoglycerate kinase [Methanomassiliicoccales archaeon PtaU1.Bin124]|nr:MAG: Phosphoglycerate kinase [Methanomassiliicoccales archaeon PtaU1.Bin124]